MQKSEYQSANGTQSEADQKIAYHETANHGRDQSQRNVNGIAALQREQHDSGRAHVLLPSQHEEGQEGNEGTSQKQSAGGSETACEEVAGSGCSADLDHVFFLRFPPQSFQTLCLLAEAHDVLAQMGGVLGQVLHQHYGLVVGVVDNGHDSRQQKQNGDKSSQAAGQMQPGKKIHYRGQHKRQQNRNQHDSQDGFAVIAERQDTGDSYDVQRPVKPACLRRWFRCGQRDEFLGFELYFVVSHGCTL